MHVPMAGQTAPQATPPESVPRARFAPAFGLAWGRSTQIALLGILLLYLILRGLAWHSAALVEDHGSISQLVRAKVFLTFDLRQIAALEPDTTPFYPLSVAIFSLPGWPVDTAARLCSFTFSLLLFFTVAKLGARIAGPWATAAGLLLLSLNPILVRLSPAILTEPSYVATVYLGLWLFWSQYDRPTVGKAAGLGLVFGLAFLNRIEAVLFLPAIPVFQAVHYLGARERGYGGRRLAGWVLAFVICFAMVAAPQVWWVSRQMGRLAINGRQVWSEVMVQTDQRYEGQIYGLDYSPSVINLTYLQAHPEAMPKKASRQAPLPLRYGRLLVENGKDLAGDKLRMLIGYFACILFVFGLGVLTLRGQRAEVLLVLGFLAVTLAGPLLHNVVVRHIVVIAPLMLLIGGIGVVELARRLASWTGGRTLAARWAAALLLLAAGLWAPALRRALHRETCNREYCVETMDQMSPIVRSAREQGRPPRVAARKQYLAYFAGGAAVPLPYADYDRLVRFLKANRADYLFLERWQIQGYPFVAAFGERSAADFTLLDRHTDPQGRTSELYRLEPPPGAAALPPHR